MRRRQRNRHREDDFRENNVHAIHQRLDKLGERLDLLSQREAAVLRSVQTQPNTEVAHALRAIEERLERLITESGPEEFDRRVAAVDRALERINRAPVAFTPAPQPQPVAPDYGFDRAMAEISARQYSLDSGTPYMPPAAAAPPPSFAGLDEHLRNITRELESLRRPCNFEQSVNELRKELREIARAFTQAQPRAAVEELESEVDAVSNKVDVSRSRGGNGADLAAIERGLNEVREALHQLAPAENLAGFERHLQHVADKIDMIAAGGQDQRSLAPLESAIADLREVVAHVASNDALSALAREVRALNDKIEEVAASARAEGTERIEALIHALADRLDRGAPPADYNALDEISRRISVLADRLDQSRLGNLGAIEHGISELLAHMEEARAMQLPHAAAQFGPSPDIEGLKRDIDVLKQVQTASDQRTQDTLESVHAMLERMVDRLAMLEGELRDSRTAFETVPAPAASVAAPVAAPPPPAPAVPAAQYAPPPAGPRAPAPQEPEVPRPAVRSMMAAVRGQPAAAPATAPAAAQRPQGQRQPIDPSLPADHPLEPGTGTPRARTPVIPPTPAEPPGHPNFIAAARRAAKAAAAVVSSSPAPAAEPAAPVAAEPRNAEKDQAGKKRQRSILVSVGIFLLFVGTIHLIANFFIGNSQQTKPEQPTQTMPAPQAPAEPAPPPSNATPGTDKRGDIDPAKPAAEPPARQSALPQTDMTVATVPAAGIVVPPGETATPNLFSKKPALAKNPADVTGSVTPQPVPQPPAKPRDHVTATPSAALTLPPKISPLLREAALKGDPNAEYELGARFAEGRGVPRNPELAAQWFERAAEHGLAPAMYRLGSLYEKGQGVRKDLAIAQRLYRAAAERGNAKAMHNLAVLFAEGIDGKPDYASAAQWFALAADYGVTDSQYNVAILYARGLGVEQNLAEAYKWLALAARQGDPESAKKRDDVARRLDAKSLALAKAAAEQFVAKQEPGEAVNVAAPAGGWDRVATIAPAPHKTKPHAPKRR